MVSLNAGSSLTAQRSGKGNWPGMKLPICQCIFSVIFLNVSFLKNEMD